MIVSSVLTCVSGSLLTSGSCEHCHDTNTDTQVHDLLWLNATSAELFRCGSCVLCASQRNHRDAGDAASRRLVRP